MLVSIAILAHNEASDIGNIILDLGSQNLLLDASVSIEIHVVANGCTDATVAISQAALTARPFKRKNIATFVHNLHQAGKSNAWNTLIHRLASPRTDVIFLLDADIRIPEATSLQLMLNSLTDSKAGYVAVDKSVKDLALKRDKTIIERLILAASGTASDTRTAIAGGLYCARFEILKRIWMPIGLPGEDGYLRAMILTSNLTEDENLEHHVYVENARHIFESERRMRDVFRHNIRLTIGTAINVLLFRYFRETLDKTVNISDYVRQRNTADPDWINELIANKIREGNYFVIDPRFVLRRLQWFFSLSAFEQIKKAPIALLGILFDLALFLTANHLMRRGAGSGFW